MLFMETQMPKTPNLHVVVTVAMRLSLGRRP
jgi:hypothetical protein